MKFTRFYKVLDGAGKLRFESVYKVDCEFFVRRLLQRLKLGQQKPTIVSVDR